MKEYYYRDLTQEDKKNIVNSMIRAHQALTRDKDIKNFRIAFDLEINILNIIKELSLEEYRHTNKNYEKQNLAVS